MSIISLNEGVICTNAKVSLVLLTFAACLTRAIFLLGLLIIYFDLIDSIEEFKGWISD